MYWMQAGPASFPTPDPGSAEKAGEKRYKGGTDEGNTAAGHELLHALGLGAGVVVAITFQKVDGAPDAKACSECDHESLKYFYCAVKEIHSPRNQNRRFTVFCCFSVFRQNPKEKQAFFCRPVLLRFWLLLS